MRPSLRLCCERRPCWLHSPPPSSWRWFIFKFSCVVFSAQTKPFSLLILPLLSFYWLFWKYLLWNCFWWWWFPWWWTLLGIWRIIVITPAPGDKSCFHLNLIRIKFKFLPLMQLPFCRQIPRPQPLLIGYVSGATALPSQKKCKFPLEV